MSAPRKKVGARLGDALRQLRHARGVRQNELASALGLKKSTWNLIENGRRTLSVERFAAACTMLGASPADVWASAFTRPDT